MKTEDKEEKKVRTTYPINTYETTNSFHRKPHFTQYPTVIKEIVEEIIKEVIEER